MTGTRWTGRIAAGFAAVLLVYGLALVAVSYTGVGSDPSGDRQSGIGVIVLALFVAAIAGWLLYRARRMAQGGPSPDERAQRARRRLLMGRIQAVAWVALTIGGGIGMLIYSASLDGQASDYRRAAVCGTPGSDSADCIVHRVFQITSVDVSNGKSGETDTVHFVDATGSHKAFARPGGQDTSPLRTGATGYSSYWRGRYTTLHVQGFAYPTEDNPVYSEGQFRLLGIVLLLAGLVPAGLLVLAEIRRRSQAPAVAEPATSDGTAAAAGGGALRSTAELLQEAGTLPVLIKPQGSMANLAGGALAGLVFLPLVVLSFGDSRVTQLVFAVLFGGMYVALFGYQLLYRLTGGLFVDVDRFGERRPFGRARSFPRSEAGAVSVRTVITPGSRAQPTLALVESPDGRILFKFGVRTYGDAAVSQFARVLGIPVDGLGAPPAIASADVARQSTAGPSWIALHPRVVGVVIALVLIAVLSFVAIATGPPSHR